MAALPGRLAHAKAHAPYTGHLAEIDITVVTDRNALVSCSSAQSDLMAIQKVRPCGMTTIKAGRLQHVFVSPGPIYDPEGIGVDPWRYARALPLPRPRAFPCFRPPPLARPAVRSRCAWARSGARRRRPTISNCKPSLIWPAGYASFAARSYWRKRPRTASTCPA